MISNWEDAKKRSNYHFNKKIKDTDNIKHIGRFVGTWKDEVDNVINDTKKINWSNRRLSTDRPNNDVEAEENDLIQAGANPKMTIYRGLKDFASFHAYSQIFGWSGKVRRKRLRNFQ